MNAEIFNDYCMQKKGISQDFPFDDRILVYRVGGKIFALCEIENFDFVNLKCDPEYAIELREQFEGIFPAYHMNKKHWNSVDVQGLVPDPLIFKLIDHSYKLVFNSLSKKLQAEIGE
ncbi:MAG: MmcQ/YjbR family DNA-binding protein [Luteibaculum sp.]